MHIYDGIGGRFRCCAFHNWSCHLIFRNAFSVTYCSVNRICHWSLMQKEKSLLEGQRTMLETRFTKFPALSVDPRVGISRSALEPDD